MSQAPCTDESSSKLLTMSPAVQRFALGTAILLAGCHAAGMLRTQIAARLEGSEREQRHLAGTHEHPLLAVDINQASAQELALLPQIGPVAAAAIVESRRVDGPFLTVADLERVHGIGPKTVEAVRPFILLRFPSQGADDVSRPQPDRGHSEPDR